MYTYPSRQARRAAEGRVVLLFLVGLPLAAVWALLSGRFGAAAGYAVWAVALPGMLWAGEKFG